MDSLLGNIQARYSLPQEADKVYSSSVLFWLQRLLARDPRERPLAADVASALQALICGSRTEVHRETADDRIPHVESTETSTTPSPSAEIALTDARNYPAPQAEPFS